jgi:hypothetical protein
MTITVEPGCYFIDHLIDEAIHAEYSSFSAFLNADDLNHFGGIRLEDVNDITADGCENYTICPRTIQKEVTKKIRYQCFYTCNQLIVRTFCYHKKYIRFFFGSSKTRTNR